MVRTTTVVMAVVAAGALLSACGGGAGSAGSTDAAGSTAQASSFTAPGGSAGGAPAGTPGATAPGGVPGATPGATPGEAPGGAPGAGGTAAGDERPATAGRGTCVDLGSPVVQAAVAKLPPFMGSGYRAVRGTEAALGACPRLLWVHADLDGGTGSSPAWTLFFDRQGYLGTAVDRPTAFTSIVGSTDDSVAIAYRWLNPGDATAGPSGGPVVITYTLTGRSVTPNKAIPPQVFGSAPSTAAPTAPAASTPASTAPR